MPDWLNAIILGIIEGLTEFIPVSSTGHLLIAEWWLPRETDVFNIVIQSAAALALIPLFWTKGTALVSGLGEKKNIDFLAKLMVAFLITVVGGLALKKLGYTLPKELSPVAWALLIGGIIIFAVETWSKGRVHTENVTWTLAVAFGVGQLLAAIFPGLSRSGGTIMLAMILGMSRPAATEFSFMLGVPTLLGSGAYELYKEMKEHTEHVQWSNVIIGSVVSFIVSFIVVKWLIHFVKSHTFNGFAAYRVVVGGLLLAWLAMH